MLRSKVRSKISITNTMEQKYIRKVARTGKRSLSIVIPAEIATEMKIREKQKLVIKRVRGGILIKDWKK